MAYIRSRERAISHVTWNKSCDLEYGTQSHIHSFASEDGGARDKCW